MPFSIIVSLAKWVGEGVLGYFKHRRELAVAKQASELRWAEQMATASGSSWKDEYVTILISLPILGAMFNYPQLGERMFAMMAKAPDWYVAAFLVVVGGSFGVNLLGRYKRLNGVNGNGAPDPPVPPSLQEERG